LLQRPDSAAELHRVAGRLEDRLDRLAIAGGAREGAVEIDDVQPAEALPLELRGLRRRIFIIDAGCIHVAMAQPDAAAILQIDGREEDRCHFRASTSGNWL